MVETQSEQSNQGTAGAKGPPARASLAIVYFTIFLDLLGFGIILPLMPFYALHFGARPTEIGLLFAAFSIAQLVSAPLLGRLSDRIGRRPVLLISLLGASAAFVATGLSFSLYTFIAARAFAGLFAGSIATAQAYVADVTTPAERTKYMGLVGASIGMGFVFGPWIGAELSRFGFGTAAFVSAGLAFLNFVLALVLLRESLPPELRGQARLRMRTGFSFARLRAALGQPVVGQVLSAGFLTMFAFVAMETTFSLLGFRKFGLNQQQLGRTFGVLGIVIAIVQGGLVGKLAKLLGERRLAMIGAVVVALGLGALPWQPTLTLTVVCLLLVACGQGLLQPCLSTLLSRSSAADAQGGVLGLGQSLSSLARVVSPLIAGVLFERDVFLPYALAATLMLGVCWLLSSLPLPAES